MSTPSPGGLYRAYAGLTALAAPLIHSHVRRKMASEGVALVRIAERFGEATEARPRGGLVWFHAVSVGEALSVLGLIEEMGRRDPKLQFLITSVSATSARLVAERLPPRTRHQFAPLDTTRAVARFLDHWAPSLAVFVESELWPRQIIETSDRGIPLALVNARLSARSRARWGKWPVLARAILTRFRTIVCQTEDTARGLAALGAETRAISVSGDLKAASARLPLDESLLDALEAETKGRRIWVAASTHPGEEERVTKAHPAGHLLILAPRHPERGDEIARALRAAGWDVAQRSKQDPLQPETQIYLADTLGEMGLWYALAPTVFLGGSLVEVGGHNPFEPAQYGAAVLTGPHVTNFRESYDQMFKVGAARMVRDAGDLHAALRDLEDGQKLAAMQRAAAEFVRERTAIRDYVADRLMPLLEDRNN